MRQMYDEFAKKQFFFRKLCGHWVVGSGVCGLFCLSAEAGEDCEWEEENVRTDMEVKGGLAKFEVIDDGLRLRRLAGYPNI